MLQIAEKLNVREPLSLGGNPPLLDWIEESRMLIGPDLANRILTEARFAGQRPINIDQAFVYAEMMDRGLWGLTDPLSFARVDDTLTLINGYHRLSAVVIFGKPVEFRIAVNSMKDMKEVKASYYRYDTIIRRRSTAQILNAIDLAARNGVSKSVANSVYGAIGFINNGLVAPKGLMEQVVTVKNRVVDLRLEACEPYWDAARKLEEAIKPAPREVHHTLLRSSRFAVALVTMRHQPLRAKEFWQGVAENDGLRRVDPRNVYLRDLLGRVATAGEADHGVIATAQAWNAFFENRTLGNLRVSAKYILRVAGTPFGPKKG